MTIRRVEIKKDLRGVYAADEAASQFMPEDAAADGKTDARR